MAGIVVGVQTPKNEQIQALKEKVLAAFNELKAFATLIEVIKGVRNLGDVLDAISAIRQMIINTVLAVEIAFADFADLAEGLKSADKLEVAVQALDKAFTLSPILELIDGPVFKIVLSLGVDQLNTRFGHDWNLDKARAALVEGQAFIDNILGLD